MDLIDINQMQQKLDEQFIPLEPTITGMRLVIKKNQKPSLEQCEVVLKVTFPASFSDLTSHYDFGHFTIGPITFCDSGNYFLWLTGINTDEMQTYAWWSGFKRPKGVIMIANNFKAGPTGLPTRWKKLSSGCTKWTLKAGGRRLRKSSSD